MPAGRPTRPRPSWLPQRPDPTIDLTPDDLARLAAEEREALALDPDAALTELEERYAERMGEPGGLRYFLEDAWPIFEPAQPFQGNWHHDVLCEHLEAATRGEIRYLLISLAPRHGKSTLTSLVYPCWTWGPARQAWSRWLFASYGAGLSARDSRARRAIMGSAWYRSRWPHVQIGRQGADGAPLKDTEMLYQNTERGFHMATSVTGASTGEGGHYLLFDDPLKTADADSETVRESIARWWDETMSTRMNDASKTVRIGIMTRVHAKDLTGHILERWRFGQPDSLVNVDGDHVLLSIPTEYTGQKYFFLGQDPRTEIGELLWPERFPRFVIDRAKNEDLGPINFSAQHQQMPSPPSGAFFKADWLRFYVTPACGAELAGSIDVLHPAVRDLKPAPMAGHAVGLRPHVLRLYWQSVDAAFKKLDTSDYVAIQMWAKDGAMRYLIDQTCQHLGFNETCDAIRAQRRLYERCRMTLVEGAANGAAIVDRLMATVTGLREVPADKSKVARAGATHPLWRAGQVWLPHPVIASWVPHFCTQLLAFPYGPNDDQVDAMAHALNHDTLYEEFDDDRFASSHD